MYLPTRGIVLRRPDVVNDYFVVTAYLYFEVAGKGGTLCFVKSKKRPYHHGDLREALLQAGEVMLERVGPEALSMRELAREVGVSNNAPRRHFASKQALLDALALQGFEQLGAALNRGLADQDPDFEKRLVKLARANIRFATSHRALRRLMFTAKQRENAPPEVVEAAYKGLSAGPATIAYGQSVGAVGPGDTRLMSITVFAALEGLLSLSVDGKFGGIPLERLMQDVIHQIILGLRPRRKQATA
jgi:AcrR family transcriptional regulator